MEKLVSIIFRECYTRQKMNEGLQDMLMVCQDRRTIALTGTFAFLQVPASSAGANSLAALTSLSKPTNP